MFFIGFVIGVFVGIMMIALCIAAGKEHDAEDELNRK